MSPLLTFAAVDSLQTKAIDSLGRNKLRDSLSLLQQERRTLCRYPLQANDAYTVLTPRLFSDDVTSPSEALATSPFSVPVRFSLSSQLNRFLPYGNIAPVTTIFNEGFLEPTLSGGPFTGTDAISTGELSSIALGPNNTYRYSLYPVQVAVPEGSFFWENGVFDEDILNAHFLRPLSERMTINLFSSYRYFTNKTYTHEGNNVSSFYKGMYTDSTLVSDSGYNPLTSEYDAGLRLHWKGAAGNEVVFGAKYADWSTEMALNRSAVTATDLYWSRLNQYRSSLDLGSINNRFGGSMVDVTGSYENDVVVKFTPDSTDNTIMLRKDGADQTLSLAARVSSSPRGSDTLACIYRFKQNSRNPFDTPLSNSFDHTPELSYFVPYRAGPLQGGCTIHAGYIVSKLDTVLGYAPTWSFSAENGLFGQRLRLYAKQGAIPYSVPFDSALFQPSTLLDLYRMGGADIIIAAGMAGCIAGCQSIEGINDITVRHSWPEGVPPYKQPHLVFLAAPYLGPWHGLTISSRGLFADRRPFVKAQGSATYTSNPRNTGEYIDLRLCFDYWSKRDSLLFANINDWDREIYDLNLEIAVHVKTFRFFSKIDNILNRKITYVPGYLLPGISFRWGITWFLQR